jgi:catechol 2,3-dioxygenase-like lactoylglutathione lyase family enzyme
MKRVCATVVMAAIGLVAATARNGDTVERPKIRGIEGVEIRVSDPAPAGKVYSQLDLVMDRCRICGWRHGATILPTGQKIISRKLDSEKPAKFLTTVGFQIDDLRTMMKYLKSRNVPFQTELPVDGDGYLTVADPEGHQMPFVEFAKSYSWLWMKDEIQKAPPASVRLIHTGFVVKDRAAVDKFYRDILGFHVYWHCGMKDGETDWVDKQVPDGTDWIEYMLNVPENADKRTLGVMNHIALGVPDVKAAAERLRMNGVKLTEEPKIGGDGKWQLNLNDPDDTRVELIEFTPAEKQCCAEYTGAHPKP